MVSLKVREKLLVRRNSPLDKLVLVVSWQARFSPLNRQINSRQGRPVTTSPPTLGPTAIVFPFRPLFRFVGRPRLSFPSLGW